MDDSQDAAKATAELRPLADRVYSAEDKRKVVRVTLTGHGDLSGVELHPDWRRSIQTQALDREIASAFAAARRQAKAEAAAAAGFGSDQEVSQVVGQVRRLLDRLPEAREALSALESERFLGESARGRVSVCLDGSGDLLALKISSRHAAQSEPDRLSQDIVAAFRAAMEERQRRCVQVRVDLTGGRSLDDRLREDAVALRERMNKRVDQLRRGRQNR